MMQDQYPTYTAHPLNYGRIYEYRFRGVNHEKKQIVWKEISHWLYNGYLKKPDSILDPAGGLCEFINHVPARDKWTVDIEKEFVEKYANPDVQIIVGNNLQVALPQTYTIIKTKMRNNR